MAPVRAGSTAVDAAVEREACLRATCGCSSEALGREPSGVPPDMLWQSTKEDLVSRPAEPTCRKDSRKEVIPREVEQDIQVTAGPFGRLVKKETSAHPGGGKDKQRCSAAAVSDRPTWAPVVPMPYDSQFPALSLRETWSTRSGAAQWKPGHLFLLANDRSD